MDRIIIRGGRKLNGEVKVSGAKNSALKLLFSTILAEGEHIFHNVPELKDVESTISLLEIMGSSVNRKDKTVRVNSRRPKSFEAHYDVVRKMRASILCLGPLLTKYGEAQVSLPGGCAIGTRPINLHLDGLKAMGADIELKEGYVVAKAKRLIGASMKLAFASVGATENIMMAATLAKGTTLIDNAAKEPEIVDLANYLNKMGAKITGAGTSIIQIEGVDVLNPAEHSVIADRIEAGTLLIAGAITGGAVKVSNCHPEHIEALILKLRESGFKITQDQFSVSVAEMTSFKSVDVKTAPYPGFATDLQAQFMSLMLLANGTSTITETIFENRFMHVNELMRLGADVSTQLQVATVKGTPHGLQGAPLMATDLRASASLVLAGLAAKGETIVSRIYHLDRGYEKLEEKLKSLGADIQRIK
jgi:UDP-N-acetylglucosamine 1-carboxyvinyltransferase